MKYYAITQRWLDLLKEAQSSPSLRSAAHAAEHMSKKHTELSRQGGDTSTDHTKRAAHYATLASTAREKHRLAQNRELKDAGVTYNKHGQAHDPDLVHSTLDRIENEHEAQNRADKPAARQGRQTDDTRGEARPSRQGGVEMDMVRQPDGSFKRQGTGRSNPESIQKQQANEFARGIVRTSTRQGTPSTGGRKPKYAGKGVRVRPDAPYTMRGKTYGGATSLRHMQNLEHTQYYITQQGLDLMREDEKFTPKTDHLEAAKRANEPTGTKSQPVLQPRKEKLPKGQVPLTAAQRRVLGNIDRK